MKGGKVVKRKQNHNDNPFGNMHDNPMLDTRVYEVEFFDKNVGEFTANMIVENIYIPACMLKAMRMSYLRRLLIAKKSAVTDDNMYMFSGDGCNPRLRRTTIG